jgi:Uma2 family endonuclease
VRQKIRIALVFIASEMHTYYMPTVTATALPATASGNQESEPLLEAGDRLTRAEFERRYARMPHIKKAELIEGIVYMPSPVRVRKHGKPHSRLNAWLEFYELETPGAECANNSTVRLDLDNESQPDLLMIKTPEKGGQSRVSEDDYLEGAPELVVEIVASSAAYDLHQKKGVYRRNGVREYLAWITTEQQLLWWELREGEYQEIPPDPEGVLKSRVFPGLWLDTRALLRGDMKAVLATLRRGLESAEHRTFVG